MLNNKKLFLIVSSFSGIYFLFSIFIYLNNLNNGFDYGILYGNLFNNHFCDEFRYFKDSQILFNHFTNDGFSSLINKTLPSWEFMDLSGHPGFGNYNIFVIGLSLLKFLGFNTVLEFVSLKIIFYPLTIFFLYKLFNIYLNERYSLIAVIVFSILPGYMLTNTILMRDNINMLFIVMTFYYVLCDTITIKHKIYALIPLILILLGLRAYLAPIFIASIIFCYKNSKKVFSYRDLLFLIVITMTLIFFTTFKFEGGQLMILGNFSDEQMRILQENFTSMYGYGIIAPIKVFYLTVLHIFYVPPFLSFMFSGLIYLVIFSLGNIVSVLTSIIFIPSFIYTAIKENSAKINYLLKFTCYFTFLCGILLMSKDGFIITRLSLMWTPLFIIIIFVMLNKITFNKKVY